MCKKEEQQEEFKQEFQDFNSFTWKGLFSGGGGGGGGREVEKIDYYSPPFEQEDGSRWRTKRGLSEKKLWL